MDELPLLGKVGEDPFSPALLDAVTKCINNYTHEWRSRQRGPTADPGGQGFCRALGLSAGQLVARGAPAEGGAGRKSPRSACSTRTATYSRVLRREERARLSAAWACYHTELYEFEQGAERFGIIGCAVGASFAVLLAEQLFVSGCRFLVSMTSAGQIVPQGPPPYFVVIDRALRDEGTSYHYLPQSEFAEADPSLVAAAMAALAATRIAGLSRRGLDDRRAVPRDRRRDRAMPRPQHPGGRDGGGGAVRIRPRPRKTGPVPGARDKPDGRRRRRFRKRGSGGRHRLAGGHRGRGAGVAPRRHG